MKIFYSSHVRLRLWKCEYVKTTLLQTEGCGWGLLTNENIKVEELVIEHYGEVISRTKARGRSQVCVSQCMKDAYIIFLNAKYCDDATKKGNLGRFNLARFINHSW
ncbi:hypothetical protein VitviT2T_013774 [Vitis vinifera]|uniref:SET domain-containing protein n=2 Tax=Vitis vinifera TaxID=29760 RepID=A0ABY9CLZ9_VITVI